MVSCRSTVVKEKKIKIARRIVVLPNNVLGVSSECSAEGTISSKGVDGNLGELFRAFATTATTPRLGGPLADGRAFARWLSQSQKLPDAGRVESLAVDLRYRSTPQGLVPRRGPALRFALLHRERRLVIAVRLPWLGERWLTIPFGYARPLRAVSAKEN